MFNDLRNTLTRNLTNARGWRTDRKIIVIESDDWGSIRMASKKAQEELKKKGYQIEQCPYNLNDRIEGDADLEGLAETLLSVKDVQDNPAKFTLNNVMANPDFEKIRNASFEKYFFEPFTQTLQQYPDSQNVMSLYNEGISNNIFQPQLHGREHINLRLWLNRLQEGDTRAKDAFDQKMCTVNQADRISGRRDNLDTFGNSTLIGVNFNYNEILGDAQRLFKDTWGFKSTSFIAPCYVWHPSLERILMEEGIQYIQGTYVQRIPLDNESYQIKRKYHYTGQQNESGQSYLVRNCFFEPTGSGENNAVEKVLKEIKLSFAYKTPAIICSHRVNYVGSLKPKNRSKNLILLKELLNQIIKHWPEVEFMSTDQLGALISKKK